ncbi:MAG TPA: twin-arginine translocase subunit TatC [Solirubrobacteraceae bacterium]|nr:twin-arginine translocase subunit TatC [Solirubrobacteraceae bacterium]
MAVAVGHIGHEEQLSVVEHLDELRTRLIVCLAVIAVAFGLCVWQNHRLLDVINAPLTHETQKQVRAGNGPLGSTYTVQQGARTVAGELQLVVGVLERPGSGASAATRASLAHVAPALRGAVKRLSAAPQGNKPVTLWIGEPFTTTLGISLIFALILSLPVLLYEMYGFLLPAFSPEQQRVATPLMLAIPFLFVAGVVFGYFVVLPAAVRFFQNFNSEQFNVLVQASQYYHFAAVILLAMGLVFQVPVGVLAATRAGIVTPKQLRHNRRYAVLACGAVAALLPGDAITLLLETVPLYLLFELSVLLASAIERRDRRRAARAGA